MISPDQREEWIIRQARQRPGAERAVFLDGACAGDAALRERLERLLAVPDQPEEVLAESVDAATVKATIKLDFADTPDQAVGQTIGRYKVLQKIGEGGCGAVYMAEQEQPVRRRVALKVIKLGMDTKAVIARFEAERQALALMDHPNIARVLDAGATDTGRPFFVMELVRGIKFTDYCDQNHLDTRTRLELFVQICQAIQHAHQKGIIHRDIKPSNILVTLHDGVPVPKVIDFGIAKATTDQRLTDKTLFTAYEQFIGTPAYMSPEQAEMSGLDVDTRSDIYSLGVLLYELLTGRTPFDPKELMESGLDAMRKTIREKEPARPSTKLHTLQREDLTTTAERHGVDVPKLISQLRGDLDWIVMKCLEKDRTRRYETANGLAMDIKRHLTNEPVIARPPSKLYEFQKTMRRHKFGFAAAAAIVLVLAVGIALTTWQALAARKAERDAKTARRGEQQQRLQAQQKQVEAEGARQQADAARERADAKAREATESREQARRLLYDADMNLAQQALKQNNLGLAQRLLDRHRPASGEQDLRDWEWRYLWQQTRSSALVTLTNRSVRAFDVSFSPDGTRLAVGWFDGRVDLWDVPGRQFIRSLSQRNETYQGHVAFSPARDLLAATSGPNTVSLYDLDSNRESIVWQPAEQGTWEVRDLSFSRDGSRLVIYANSGRAQGDAVWVVKVDSGHIERRVATAYSETVHHGAARLSPDNQRLYVARSDAGNYRYSVRCIELATGKELWETKPQRDAGLTALAVSPDGGILASGSGFEDPTIRLWDAHTGQLIRQLDGHTSWVSKLRFTPDGQQLISAAADQTIRVWDARTWTETRVLRGHRDEVGALAVCDRVRLIASGGKDGNLMLWHEDGKGAAGGYIALPDAFRNARVRPLDQSRMLLLLSSGTPQLLDLKNDRSPIALPQFAPPARVLGCFGTNTLCYWNGSDQILAGELRGTNFVPRGAIKLNRGADPGVFTFNAGHQLLSWAQESPEPAVYVASLAAPDRRTELKGGPAYPRLLLLSPAGDYLAAAGPGRAQAWRVETGQVVASIDRRVTAAVFAAGGRMLVADIPRGLDHEISFYDLSQPQRAPQTFPGKARSLVLAVSPDSRLVAASTFDGYVRLFDAVKGEPIEAIRGHLNGVFGVAFSPNGKRLISASGGRETIKLWDLNTRQELLTLAGSGSALLNATWSPDGNEIVAGTPWQVWSAPSWEEIEAAEARQKAAGAQP